MIVTREVVRMRVSSFEAFLMTREYTGADGFTDARYVGRHLDRGLFEIAAFYMSLS
jgi:hypothetical protein